MAQVIGSAYVPSTRTITINGTTQDLSANRTYNVGDMLLDTVQTVTARKDFNTNTLHLVVNGTSQKTVLANSPIDTGSYSLAINFLGFNASNNIYFSKGGNNNGIFAFNNASTRTYTLKDASGTLAFTSDIPANPVGGTGASGQVAYFNGTTSITSESALFWDATNDRLGIGVSPSQILHLYGTSIRPQIESTGNGGYTSLRFVGKNSAGTARTFEIGLNITADDVWQITNGSSSFVSVSTSGNLLVGTTTDAGFKLDVNGTAKATKLVSASNAFAGTLDFGTGSFKGIMDYTASSGLWSLNNQTAGSGTTAYFQFQADSSPIVTMLKNGNVGIGTSSPGYRLVVNSSTDGISAGISGNTYGIRFDNGGTFSSGMSTIHGVDNTLIGSYQPIMLNGLDVRFGTSANERMRITSGGNVLIGTTTDNGARLQVAASVLLSTFTSTTSTQFTGLEMKNGGGSFYFGQDNSSGTFYGSGAAYAGSLYLSGGYPMAFFTSGTERMRITSGGNVLIGTTTNGASRLRIVGLPTSSAGLSSGDVWSDSGTLKIA